MRDEAATGAARGVFNVEHLVVENVFDGALRDIGAVHASIEKNLIGAGIVASELAAPAAKTPSDVRLGQLACKIFRV